MHSTKIAVYGSGNLLTPGRAALRLRVRPGLIARLLGREKIVGRMRDIVFVTLVEIGLAGAGVLF